MLFGISDRYIIRSFTFSFLICFATLASLFAVIDTFVNLSDLVTSWRQWGKPLYYLPMMVVLMNAQRMPLIFAELAPVLTLSAAMFTIARLRRANELTPLLASGVSVYRILWPIFFMAIVVTVAQTVDKEVLVPRFGSNLSDWDRVRDPNLLGVRNQAMMADGYGNVLFAGRYYIAEKKQVSAQITKYWHEAVLRTPKVILNAKEARWVEAPQSGWLYTNGTRIEYDLSGNVLRQSSFAGDGTLVPYREDGRTQGANELVTDAAPERLETGQVDITYRPTLELMEYAHQHGMRLDVALDINRRVAAPLVNFVLLLIGVPFALKRDLRSPFLGVAVAVLITGGYHALSLLCENFALQGRFLTPLTGAWAPIIVFGPVGVLLFDTIES